MANASDNAATALEIMRSWSWVRCDPDGQPFPPGIPLSSIVSRLAFDGIRRPEGALLQLLCQGDLLADGHYRWRKYQDMEHYQQEGYTRISKRHWQHLADALAFAETADGGSKIEENYQFPMLKLEDCQAFTWDYNRDGFSYANQTSDLAAWDNDYLEEWFSAWDIEAWPRFVEGSEGLALGDETPASGINEHKPARGRSAAKWWPDFAEELALTIHEEGIPEGTGHEGQSELLDKVLARLSATGKLEPGRSTVQPVINAVLARIRSAGK